MVLAAGIGSRFKGAKQLEPLTEAGNVLIEYSVFDAIRAGFGKVVFVIRRALSAEFEDLVRKFDGQIDVHFAFQDEQLAEMDMLPQRDKPWGTGHAVLASTAKVNAPFVVINADDYYGATAYQKAFDYLAEIDPHSNRFAMLGYSLCRVLSPHGGVSRGVCEVAADGRLQSIHEFTDVAEVDGDVVGSRHGATESLSGSQLISMNIWMFTPALFPLLRKDFQWFVSRHGHDKRAEFTLSDCLGRYIEAGDISIECLPHDDQWFGITYREDRAHALSVVDALHRDGTYPTPLWQAHAITR